MTGLRLGLRRLVENAAWRSFTEQARIVTNKLWLSAPFLRTQPPNNVKFPLMPCKPKAIQASKHAGTFGQMKGALQSTSQEGHPVLFYPSNEKPVPQPANCATVK